jgi:SAM-dependent methyltransferase
VKKSIASNIEWKKWGEKDPLMGVATRSGKSRFDPRPWTDEEFYELGRSDWNDFHERWKRYGIDHTTCLEIGCGTGRITRELGRCFDTVYALDVSKGMIEYAKKKIQGSTVRFMVGDGLHISLQDASVTAVFSTHVFQHFDSLSHGTRYFEEISRVLSSEGTMMIHLPVHQWPAMPGLFERIYRLRKSTGGARAWIKRRLILAGISHHYMRGLSYPVGYLFDILAQQRFMDIELLLFRTSKENAVHPFVFARRE